MKYFILVIPFLALLLLAAHSLRFGDYGLMGAFAVLAGLMFTRQAWVRWGIVAALLWGGFIWADATVNFVNFRHMFDLPWKRLAVIMATIILFDGLALMIMLSQRSKGLFSVTREKSLARGVVFVLTILGLSLARTNASFPILLADRYLPGWGWAEIFALGVYAQWISGLMMQPRGHRTLRPRIWGVFSALFFLQLGLGLLGMEQMLMTGTLHLPVPALILGGPIFRGGGFFMLILFSVTILLVGPAWCSHLCYIGAWDDGMSRLGPRPAHSSVLRRMNIAGRGTTLLLTVATALILRSIGMSGSSAIVFAVFFGLIGVGIMAFVSRKVGMMTHCTTFCPMGLVANVMGKISPWRIRIDSDCTRCGACYTRCRYNALDESRMELGRPALSCTLCGDCVSACADKQIGYRFPGLSSENARTVFIVLVVTLHAVFLGVARI
ncbi:4Fe-4S binding protein [uncultured Pseudodesulfovibrio sp.]|uniref:4Fe-4S binding protein n=1 Tax=uncultured Pseudodesulfovibrio sp. TaxID=2035858 RepID=UPI0029C9497F|nr:4Fe-4S binding protein [uncultured Pseudodesulfovibrio sp.]